jgi:hypothetical protein
MDPVMIPILGIVFSLFVAPCLVFGFIIMMKKGRNDVEKIRLQKEMKEIEMRKEEVHLKALIEENRKYDRMIESGTVEKGS